MKLKLSFLLLIITLHTLAGNKDHNPFPPIIPQPLHIENLPGVLRLKPVFYIEDTDAKEALNISLFIGLLRDMGYQADTSRVIAEKGVRLELSIHQAADSLGLEGYDLIIGKGGIKISAYKPAGLFYGMQSLLQCLPLTEGKTAAIPCFHITDTPRFRWRGMHLDVCRHFFSVETVKKYIDEMSKLKLNTFHWHLTEDQGWRIEIKKYPRLAEVGSVRKETMVLKNFNPYLGDGTPHGGYYTQEQIKEIIAYAADRYITIVPEIEMPGHSLAALTAYPEYSCTGGPFEVATTWGVFDDIYCTKEETFRFLEDILDEVAALFPGEYIHIGGDEAPKSRWHECPQCQARMEEQGLHNEHELQSYFIRRIEKHLKSRGKKLIGWDEILEGGLAPDAAVMSWRGEAGGIAAARMRHDVVMSPGFVMYFDHYQGDPVQEPFAWGGNTTLDKVYNYNPVPDSLDALEKNHILGVQANLWTEYITDKCQLEYMVFPRMMALAEIAWTNTQNKNWINFLYRTEPRFAQLQQQGVNFRIPEPFILSNDTLSSKRYSMISLYSPLKGKIRYTIDGTDPGPASRVYSRPIKIQPGQRGNTTVKALVEIESMGKSAWKQVYP